MVGLAVKGCAPNLSVRLNRVVGAELERRESGHRLPTKPPSAPILTTTHCPKLDLLQSILGTIQPNPNWTTLHEDWTVEEGAQGRAQTLSLSVFFARVSILHHGASAKVS